ncbi:MAG TPA: hypothetical protein VHN79_04650 [Lacunisphaera sp.]|nr:hypothetical protein [Lacunisphaera sp.]
MSLTAEQKQAVAAWVAAGDNLSAVQKKLSEEFKISMTYRDVRFLVDDLGLELKNAAPKADASDVSKATVAAPAPTAAGKPPADRPAPGTPESVDGEIPSDEEFPEDAGIPADAPAGSLSLEVDRIMRPGTVVSGTVTFSDGVSGKWGLDQYGRLMLDTGQKGYQPSPADVQTFQRELQLQLQRQGY